MVFALILKLTFGPHDFTDISQGVSEAHQLMISHVSQNKSVTPYNSFHIFCSW